MIEIFRMPADRKKFYAINDCIELRRYAERRGASRIGFNGSLSVEIDEFDRTDSYHILKYRAHRLVGYGRLRPIPDSRADCSVSHRVDELSEVMNRRPAFEFQRVCADAAPFDSPLSEAALDTDLEILRELFMQAFRICNVNGSRFLFCSSDRPGMKCLQDLGIRYSTLSTPFDSGSAQLVILSIAVNNSNFASLTPFRVVGGTDASTHYASVPIADDRLSKEPTVFEKNDALQEVLDLDDG